MKQKPKDKHEFALYVPQPLLKTMTGKLGKRLALTDQDLIHRITRVLRLQLGEQCILFDRESHALVELGATSGKKELVIEVLSINTNKVLKPAITFFLPLLKRDAFDAALYSLVEVGVNAIQLVITEKAQRNLAPHELERAERLMISAAEQSKNFNFPMLLPPINFALCVTTLQKEAGAKLFFDPEGVPLLQQINTMCAQKPNSISLMIGPEGDLTSAEKKQLQEAQVNFCALTPTILRACQAAALSSGIFRSIL